MKLAKFVPQPDITFEELVQVVQVLIAASNRDIDVPAIRFLGTANRHFDTFVTKYAGIQRHFEISDEEHDRLW